MVHIIDRAVAEYVDIMLESMDPNTKAFLARHDPHGTLLAVMKLEWANAYLLITARGQYDAINGGKALDNMMEYLKSQFDLNEAEGRALLIDFVTARMQLTEKTNEKE